MRLVVAALLVGGLGCTPDPEQARRDVCTAFCRCVTSGLPSQVERCVTDQCLPEIPTVPDGCLECVDLESQTCLALVDQCSNTCFRQMPLGGTR